MSLGLSKWKQSSKERSVTPSTCTVPELRSEEQQQEVRIRKRGVVIDTASKQKVRHQHQHSGWNAPYSSQSNLSVLELGSPFRSETSSPVPIGSPVDTRLKSHSLSMSKLKDQMKGMRKKSLVVGGFTNESSKRKSITYYRKRSQYLPRNHPFVMNILTLENGKTYKPTGEFEKDFIELCALVGIPSLNVAARPKRPQTPSETITVTKGRGHQQQTQPQEPPKTAENEDPPPTTFLVSTNNYEYFKPRVEIETEEEANRVFVKELYVRGWRVDQRIIDVLTITMPELERLTVIDFWNAGLTDNTVLTLGHCLANASSLKTLRLDGNCHTSSQRFDIFLSERSSVQNLSLKNCGITDFGALHLGNSLCENKSLLTLNLCFNKLSDQGVLHFAKGLRTNRTLLSLNLASNNIHNQGAESLAEVLSTFPLTHDEVVARRHLKSILSNEDGLHSPCQLGAGDGQPSATRSFTKDDKKHKEKMSGKKKESNNSKLKDTGVKRGTSSVDTSKNQKNAKNKGPTKPDRNKTPQQETEDALFDFKNPLLEKVREENGRLWITGNRSLINLNLARNNIQESGLNALYEAAKYQTDYSTDNNNRVVGTGLMRLSLQRNNFPCNHPTYVKLEELMKPRDPLYKPITPNIDENSKEDN